MYPDHILTRTLAPAMPPVELVESKSDLRVQHTAEDTLIEGLIAAATDFMDVPNGAINKALITQTWSLSVRCPYRDYRIHLPITPAQSIESITYYDSNNAQQSLDPADFYLHGDEEWAYIEPRPDITWPSVYNRLDAITITFLAGFGDDSTAVPNSIRQAIRLLVAHWYEHRTAVIVGTSTSELPMAVQSLISMNRKGWVA